MTDNIENVNIENTNENETKGDQTINVNVDTDKINESLNKLNKTLLDMSDTHVEHNEDNNFYVGNKGKDKILVDSNNNELSNYDIFVRALDALDNGAQINLTRNFIQYMRDYVDNVDKGGNPVEYMHDNIYRNINLTSVGNITKFK